MELKVSLFADGKIGFAFDAMEDCNPTHAAKILFALTSGKLDNTVKDAVKVFSQKTGRQTVAAGVLQGWDELDGDYEGPMVRPTDVLKAYM